MRRGYEADDRWRAAAVQEEIERLAKTPGIHEVELASDAAIWTRRHLAGLV